MPTGDARARDASLTAARAADALADARLADLHVATLPDFFLDHFVAAPPWDEATRLMQAVHARGGGNVPGWPQRMHPGGNATNTALALARLGVRAHLVARTSAFGLGFLRDTVGAQGVDLKHVRADGELAITTAIEYGATRTNVMLSWPGSVAEMRIEHLDDNHLTLLEGSDAVLVANWTANLLGTAFVEAVLKASSRGSALVYLDTGDPSARLAEVPDLKRRVFGSPDLDVLAINENELRLYSGVADVEEGAARLRAEVAGTLDLHTAARSFSWSKAGRGEAPSLAVAPRRMTGAGDAWNAGNLVGHVLGLAPDERLAVANAVAGLYVSGEDGLPPRLPDVLDALRGGPWA